MEKKKESYKGIIIFGCMGAGKDTFGEALVEVLPKAKLYKLGEPIRDIVDTVACYNDEVDQNRREFYQAYGQGTRDKVNKDVFNMIAYKHMVQDFREHGENLIPIIADGRQLNEYYYWREKGFLTIGMDTPEETRKIRLKIRDGYLPHQKAFIHETELQASYIVNQLCKEIISNGKMMLISDLEYLSECIKDKYFE